MFGDIGFIASFGLLSGLREQEIIYIKEREFLVMAIVVTVIVNIKLTVERD